MKHISILLAACSFVFGLSAQPTIQWQKTFGGSNPDAPYDAALTNDGGYVVAGSVTSDDGDVSGFHGIEDAWVIKLDITGAVQWKKTLGGSSFDVANAVRQTNDGGYIVAGSTRSNDGDVSGNHGKDDVWVVKLSSTGSIQWQKTLGGSQDDTGQAVQQTNDGGYIVAGVTQSNDGDVSGNHGANDIWVVKLNSNGAIQWQKALGGSAGEFANAIMQTSDGGYFVCGDAISNDGDLSPHFGTSFWAIKLNSTGNIDWQKTYGGLLLENAYNATPTADGGYVMVGYTRSNNGDVSGNHGASDYWVVKINSTGDIQWQKTLGGTAEESAFSVVQTSDGGYVVAGGSFSNNGDVSGLHGVNDIWIVKLDGNGSIQWQKTFGGSSEDTVPTVWETSDGGLIVSGYTTSSDGDLSGDHSDGDFWVFKLSPAPSSTTQAHTFPLEIFPNPARLFITIQIPAEESELSVLITDLFGREIGRQTISDRSKMQVSSLPDGLYFLHSVTPGGKTFVGKLRKQK